jgi:uncharacterized protein
LRPSVRIGVRSNSKKSLIFLAVATMIGVAAAFVFADQDQLPERFAKIPKFEMSAAGVKFHAWVANNAADRASGLMHVKKLPENTGMLFVFDHASIQSFWMKNTLIPLDIAFLDDDGVILDIHSMQPLNETPIQSEHPARFALEMAAGWFHTNKIFPGLRIQMPKEILNFTD